MALSEDDRLTLELTIEGSKEKFDELTEWEQGFMVSTEERYNSYKDNIRFSDKQWAVIIRVYSKVVE